ncbi:MAG: hypothetical protein J6D34_08290 [Atopobiaceae bacterium]|nr:hypothetical protein [Atopobiaceae bacterium]
MEIKQVSDEVFELPDEALEDVVGGRSLYDALNAIERRKWVSLNSAAISAASTDGSNSAAYKAAQRNLDDYRDDMLEKYGNSLGLGR